jgi:S-adenosyl-L-methionine hydrolase (adenosine-forming)
MIITLTTDFGYKDPFVGIMKGVIAGISPQVQVVDLSHGIPPQDIMAGALVLRHSVAYFPRGTIHVAVVDPDVGSIRVPLLAEFDEGYFIGPDNGIASLLFADQAPRRLVHLSNRTYHRQPSSATFHGRDIFAPVAAHLSLGTDPAVFGESVSDFVRLHWPTPTKSETGIDGEIVYIDSFGNLLTNIEEKDLAAFKKENLSITLGDMVIRGLVPNYAAGENGHYIALINSWGLLEIALYKDSAQRRCKARTGDKVYASMREKANLKGDLA